MDIYSSRVSHLLAGTLVASAITVAGCAQPVVVAASYEDCILQHVATGMESSVINSITRACRSKFPSDTQRVADTLAVELGSDELSRVAFRVTGSGGSTLVGVVHNGNPDLIITEVDIAYSTWTDGSETSRIYRTRRTVSPYDTYDLRLSVLPGDQNTPTSATVVAAKGRPAQ